MSRGHAKYVLEILHDLLQSIGKPTKISVDTIINRKDIDWELFYRASARIALVVIIKKCYLFRNDEDIRDLFMYLMSEVKGIYDRYDKNSKVRFSSFMFKSLSLYALRFKNEQTNVVKYNYYRESKKGNSVVFLDEQDLQDIYGEEETLERVADLFSVVEEDTRERVQALRQYLENYKSKDNTKRIIEMLLEGYKPKEIAEILGMRVKEVYNSISNFKIKAGRWFKTHYRGEL